jgi:hypothetical protein
VREIQLPPEWSGPADRRGRVHVAKRKIVLIDVVFIGSTQAAGTSFFDGVPGEDEASRVRGGWLARISAPAAVIQMGRFLYCSFDLAD